MDLLETLMRKLLIGLMVVSGLIGYSTNAKAETAEEAAGRAVFNHCIACHFIEPGKQGFGPNLHGVVGRPAATVPGFVYSSALSKSGLVWTEDNLRKWIAANDKLVPGTRMRHVGITDKAEQTYLIAFLKTLK
jgi:cytochrome c